jgi:2-methylisocitrate lyase-like PEP mutase family enzyme
MPAAVSVILPIWRASSPLPVNVMVMSGVPANDELPKLGVARISYGAIPYIRAMGDLQQEAKKALS